MRTGDFYAFIRERENIRRRKAAGEQRPWTEDEILQNYKFTNVFRKYDRTTQMLIKNWYSQRGKTADQKEILLNCAIARYFGTWEFAQALGWQTDFHPEKIKALATERLARKERVFTGAYIITNQGIKAPKQNVVVDVFLAGLWEGIDLLIKAVNHDGSWQHIHELMRSFQGFGGTGFMAKETLLDTMHCNFWPTTNSLPPDYYEWTPVGPGSLRGAARVLDVYPEKVNETRTLELIGALAAAQFELWPSHYEQLAPTDIQFQLCEFDKYERVKNGEGRPRSKYKGT